MPTLSVRTQDGYRAVTFDDALVFTGRADLARIATSVVVENRGGRDVTVYVLDYPGRVVVPVGATTLNTDEAIRLGNLTPLVGQDADTSGILGQCPGPLIDGLGDGVVVTDVFIRNFEPAATVPEAFCVFATNGANPAGRASRVERVSVGGTRGVLVENAVAVAINVLDRCTDVGIALRGAIQGVQLIDCVHPGDFTGANTPTYVELAAVDPVVRISGSVYALTPGTTAIDASGATLLPGSLVRVGNCDFIPAGGTPVVPANLANLPNAPGLFFTGNAGTLDSIFGGQIGYNGNPGSQATTIAAIGAIQPDGSVSNAVRIGTGNPANPLYVLGGASARVILDQPGGADSAVLQWAAIEPANVEVTASISLRSVDGNAKAVAGQLIYLPLGGPPQFLAAFTSVTGILALANAGFVSVSAGLQIAPGDAVAVEIANLTSGGNQNLIVDSVNLQLRSVD